MRSRLAQLMIAIVCAASLSSCASMMVRASVDSLASPKSAQETKYLLAPGNKGVTPDDLQYQEYARYIDDIMKKKGFIKVRSIRNAQIVVFLSYGIGNPQAHEYSYSLPIYGQTGVSSSTTTGMINSFGNTATYSGTTTYTPSYGVTGYTNNIGSYTTYTRYLIINAYDENVFRASKKAVQVWRTTVISTGSSNDLRLIFPIMAAAMEPYLATDTGKTKTIIIPENSKAVTKLRKDTGMQSTR